MPEPSRDANLAEGITRRQALQNGAIGGGFLLGGGWLIGCGGDDRKAATQQATEGAIRRGGDLRIGVAGGGAGDSLDAHSPPADPDVARVMQLYEPLATRNAEYETEMVLAEEITPDANAGSWTIRLKPDLVFHDGRPVTADDVLFTLRRITDAKEPKTGAATISYVDMRAAKKLDPRTVRLPLTAPNSAFVDDIGQYFMGIVPADYDVERPVGTGPFKYQSFTAGQRSVFTRNEEYWREGEPYVDSVEIIDFPADAARVNALLGGQVDAIANLPASQIAPVEARSKFKVLDSETGGWLPFTMRVDQAPFDDVRVRQAMRLLVDRQQIVDQALAGRGRIANDLYSPFDPDYANDIGQREQDLDQARSLLRSAGQSDLRVELVTSPVYGGIVEAAQVFVEQAKAAGASVRLRKVDPGTFYGDNYLQWGLAQDFWFTRPYLAQVAQSGLKESPFNETHWEDREFRALVFEARRTTDAAKRREILHAAQAIEHDRGGYIVWGFNNQVDAYSAALKGFKPSKTGIPLSSHGYRSVGFAA